MFNSIDETPEIDPGHGANGDNNGHYLERIGSRARLTLMLNVERDRESELPQENTIRSKFPQEVRDSSRPSLHPPPSLSVFIFFFPDWFCARASGLSISKGDRTREPEEPADRPTLVSLQEHGVTCRRGRAIPCHLQIGMPKQ